MIYRFLARGDCTASQRRALKYVPLGGNYNIMLMGNTGASPLPACISISRMLSSSSRASFASPCEKMFASLPHSVLESSFTPGILTPITYLRCQAWTNYFSALYKRGLAGARQGRRATTFVSSAAGECKGLSEKGERRGKEFFTAPLFQCPLCFSRTKAEKNGDTLASTAFCESSSFPHAQSNETPLKDEKSSVHGKSTAVVPPWYSPQQMVRHLSYSHMSSGYSPREFQAHNAHVMEALRQRITIPAVRDKNRRVHTNGSASSSSLPFCTTASTASFPTLPPPRLRLLVWIDVANIEMGAHKVLLDMLSSPSLRHIFQHVPIGWCTTHELFVPHSCATLHGVFQLRLQHRYSDMFPFYAPTRTESGDLAISSMISQLRQMSFAAASSTMVLPSMVLLTLDSMQRHCAMELFGTGNTGTGGGVVLASSCNSFHCIFHAFLKALDNGILL